MPSPNSPAVHREEIDRLVSRVKSHPLAADFNDHPGCFLVTYPPGDWPVEGVRASKAGGEAVALKRTLDVMERHWLASFPNAPRPADDARPAATNRTHAH